MVSGKQEKYTLISLKCTLGSFVFAYMKECEINEEKREMLAVPLLYPCASLHSGIHGDIACVQQDRRQHHRSNNDHYLISHTVARTAPLMPMRIANDIVKERESGLHRR